MTSQDAALRRHVVELLRGHGAHSAYAEVVGSLEHGRCGERVSGSPHTLWRLLEHTRIAQWDILEFSRNPDHESPEWPEGYWPAGDAPGGREVFEESRAAFLRELEEMAALVADPARDLLAPLFPGVEATLLREALLLADHNAYHLGQMVLVLRAHEPS